MGKPLKQITIKAVYVKKQGWTDPKTGTFYPFADVVDSNDVKYNLASWKVEGQLPKAGEVWFVATKDEPWQKGDKSGVNHTITELSKAITDNVPVQPQSSVKQPNNANNSEFEARISALEARLDTLEGKSEINSSDLF